MDVRNSITTLITKLTSVIWPRTCTICGRTLIAGEDTLCLRCLCGLPLTNLHHSDFNSIHQRLAFDVRIARAGAMMHYHRKGLYSGLIRNGKYNGRPQFLRYLASLYASQLIRDGFFEGIDVLIPVPMHRLKQLKRGYNQSEIIALAISSRTGIPVGDNLRATRGHATQTRRGSFERYQNVDSIFEVIHPEELSGHHVLLIDDVVTSGATLHACAKTLAEAVPGVTISVATLATATT